MNLDQFAHNLLFGQTLEEKLVSQAFSIEEARPDARFSLTSDKVPRLPGRTTELSKIGRTGFPRVEELCHESARGQMLHFFANHELLAMELMALVLLRFPEAPAAFRLGLARTIVEEQNHLRLYLGRMKDFGIKFGDLPVSEYFWKSLSGMGSPLDFVVQMSLTLEQANLDFALFYKAAVSVVGDMETAQILDRVHREEIGHVKHGLSWFNQWRPNPDTESDWDAYVRMLPLPMTPRRARGIGFSVESRREAGLSEKFIQSLSVVTGSKGRPPVVWLYNPHCESEAARGKPGYTATEGARILSQDLAHFPMFLAKETDTVLIEKMPSLGWIEQMQSYGFTTPEFSSEVRAPKIGGIEPWGWSPDAFLRFKPFTRKLVQMEGGNTQWCAPFLHSSSFESSGIGVLYSKAWSLGFFKQWLESHPNAASYFGSPSQVGAAFDSLEEAKTRVVQLLESGGVAMVKAPYGTSGMQVKRVLSTAELEGPIGGWMARTVEQQGELVVEPYLNKICDLSIQIEVREEETRIFDVRRFLVGSQNEYRGANLGKKLVGISPEVQRLLHVSLDDWKAMIRDLAERMRRMGYQGPAGIDALVYKTSDGKLLLRPLVELNPRWTMGRVALEIEKHLVPGAQAVWEFLPLREIQKLGFETTAAFAQDLQNRSPTTLVTTDGVTRISGGVVFTNDPSQAQGVLTVLRILA